MEQSSSLIFQIHSLFLLLIFLFTGSAGAYKNYTVGDHLGWYDSLRKQSVNYQKWTSGKTFNLGDFPIFNTDSNHSVVQSYNITTYETCNNDDAKGSDTAKWLATDPSATSLQPVTVSVPLLKEGMTYFFSGYYDSDQCKHGQQFKINVTDGQRLPATLKNPSDASPGPISANSYDDESAHDTVVPSNFNHPIKGNDNNHANQESVSVSLVTFVHD